MKNINSIAISRLRRGEAQESQATAYAAPEPTTREWVAILGQGKKVGKGVRRA